jgi:hypothetical protein
MSDLHVHSGTVIALRLFDIAYSIDLGNVESLWAARAPREGAVRSMLLSAPQKALAFDVPPVLLRLDPVTLRVGDSVLSCPVTARLYDFGVVALAIRVPASDMGWERYTRFCNEVDRLIGPPAVAPWDAILGDLQRDLAPAMTRPNRTLIQEDHLIAVVQEWNEPVPGPDLPGRIDLIPLLSGETRPLSEKTRRDLLSQRFSYFEDDLVVVTWDRAFICEPRHDSDVADIIEVANAQLLEFRYYDELLDDELPRMYGLVREARRATNFLASRRFADLARKLYALVAEVTELTERAENVLQVTEDVYLARIYQASLEIFRVPTVSAAVGRKLAIIRDTYSALYSEASGARGELMELAIILLIVIEIAIALTRHAA